MFRWLNVPALCSSFKLTLADIVQHKPGTWGCNLRPLYFNWCFCLKSGGLYPAYPTFLDSCQLITSIRWPCYCTVDICDSVWSFWVEANLCRFFLSFVYIHIALGDPVINRGGCNPINRFNTATFLCLFQARTCISTSHVVVLFVFSKWS